MKALLLVWVALAAALLGGAGTTWHVLARAEPRVARAEAERATRPLPAASPSVAPEPHAYLPAPDDEVAELLYHLRYGSDAKRRQVALRLRTLGARGAAALPIYVEFLTHPDDHWGHVRCELVQAAAATGPGALRFLEDLLAGRRDGEVRAAVAILAAMRDRAAPLVAPLMACGREMGMREVEPALVAIGRPAVEPLLAALRVEGVGTVLRRIGYPAARALGRTLRDPERWFVAGLAMLEMEIAARPALPDVLWSIEAHPDGLPIWTEILRRMNLDPDAAASAFSRVIAAPWHSAVDVAYVYDRSGRADDLDAEDLKFVDRPDLVALRTLAEHDTPAIRELFRSVIRSGDVAAADLAAVQLARAEGDVSIATDHFARRFRDVRSRTLHPVFLYPTVSSGAETLACCEWVAGFTTAELLNDVARLVKDPRRVPEASTFTVTMGGNTVEMTSFWLSEPHEVEVAPTADEVAWTYAYGGVVPSEADPSDLVVRLDDPALGPGAAVALGMLGWAAAFALPALERRHQAAAWSLRAHTRWARWRITGDPDPVRASFRDNDPRVRVAATQAVSPVFLPELVAALSDTSLAVRLGAAEALRGLRTDARLVLPALRTMIARPELNEDLRDALRAAIEEIDR